MTKSEVIKSFTNRAQHTNSRTALNVRDGKLYSYNLCIAEYVVEEGFQGILIHDHWAKGLGMVSSTTSHHVGMIMRATKYFPRKIKSEEMEVMFK